MATVSCIDDNRGVSSVVRVLLVEDFEPFRRFTCSKLRKKPELQVIGEVSDGMEAVRKAEELQPDVILLDVGLPTLNGIEAARRICELSPESKIVFVSQESSTDVVQEAFRLGASGYVIKSRAGIDLLAAVEAVLERRHFVSSGLLGHHSTETTDAQRSSTPLE
jgi:DNA-binding NarL/FixJ family response regulator